MEYIYHIPQRYRERVKIIALPQYQKSARRLIKKRGLAQSDVLKISAYLLDHPAAGVRIPGTNGIRKLRWATTGRGKSGGARIIYYHHRAALRVYLLDMYGKSARENLSKAEYNVWANLIKQLSHTAR